MLNRKMLQIYKINLDRNKKKTRSRENDMKVILLGIDVYVVLWNVVALHKLYLLLPLNIDELLHGIYRMKMIRDNICEGHAQH
jgi:hypothetical protein